MSEQSPICLKSANPEVKIGPHRYEIPKTWTVKTIEETSFLKGRIGWQGLTTKEYLEEGEYCLVTGTDFCNGRICWDTCVYVSEERYQQDENIQLKNDDILVTKDGTIGKIAYVEGIVKPTTLNSGLFVLRPIDAAYHPKYLYWVLNSFYFTQFINILKAGSTISHLYQRDFVNFEFPLPSLPEQKKIASILSKVDEQISFTESIIEKTEELKKGLMQQLLTKGIGHTKFKNTEIGEIPDDWDVVNVSTLFEVRNGTTPSTKAEEYWLNGNINWVTPADLSKLSGTLFVCDSARKITDKALNECNLTLMPVDSLIMSTRAPVGYLSLVKKEATFNQGCKGLIPKHANISSVFYMYYLLSSKSKLEGISGGSTFKELGKPALMKFHIPYPSPEEQQKISSILSKVDDQMTKNKNYLSNLQELKKGMMQDLLTGKVRVK